LVAAVLDNVRREHPVVTTRFSPLPRVRWEKGCDDFRIMKIREATVRETWEV
jgi:hypothetical protein